MITEWFSIEYRKKFLVALVCIALLSDWFKNLAPLSHPIRSKTNRGSLAHVFPRFVPATLASSFDWCSTVLCDWPE